jgi:hypothetical protein
VAAAESGVPGAVICEDDVLLKPGARLPEAFPGGFTYLAGILLHPTRVYPACERRALCAALAFGAGLHAVDEERCSLGGAFAYYLDVDTARWLLRKVEEMRALRHVDAWLRKTLPRWHRPVWLLYPSAFVHCGVSTIVPGRFRYVDDYLYHSNARQAAEELRSLGLEATAALTEEPAPADAA